MLATLLVAVIVAAVVSSRRPDVLSGAVVFGLALIPLSGLPFYGASHPSVIAAALAVVLGLAGVAPRGRTPFNAMDAAVVVLGCGMTASVVLGNQAPTMLLATTALWFGPYLLGRSMGARDPVKLAQLMATAGALILPFVVYEWSTGTNVLREVFTYTQDVSTDELVRLGQGRTVASQGQPILLSILLASAATAGFAIWLSNRLRWRSPWVFVVVLSIAGMASTLSRTGWLVLALGCGILCAGYLARANPRQAAALTAILAVASLAIVALPSTRAITLGEPDTDSAEIELSSQYRRDLVKQALEPGFLPSWGTTAAPVGPGGVQSIDNAYVLVAWQWGLLSLVGFALLIPAAAWKAWRARRHPMVLLWPAMSLAFLAALFGVALFGQMQVFAWLTLGAAAGVSTTSRRRTQRVGSSPSATLLPSSPLPMRRRPSDRPPGVL